MPLIKSLAAALFLGAVTLANAAPVSFTFSGVVTSFFSNDQSVDSAAKVRQVFTGSYTINTANAESQMWMLSQSGCLSLILGNCISNYGGGAPVVTAWSVTLGSDTWSWIPQPTTQLISTQLVSTNSSKQVAAEQGQQLVTGAGPKSTAVSSLRRFDISAYKDLYSPVLDYPGYEQPADLSKFDHTFFRLIDDTATCTYVVGQGCYTNQVHTGFNFDGTLTSWKLADVPLTPGLVPEPGSIFLMGLGISLMVIRRQKQV